MKLIGRTVIILAAALLVCGATFGLVNTGLLPLSQGREFEGRRSSDGVPFAPDQNAAATAPQIATDGQGVAERQSDRPRGEGRHGGFAALELIKNLAIVAVIVLVVAPIAGWLGRRRPSTAPTMRL